MDIFSYLKKDHKKVSKLLKEIENAPTASQNSAILEQIIKELILHSKTEQATFYKALKKTSKGKEKVKTAVEEHKEINDAIKKVSKLKANTPAWWIAFGSLKAIVEHHVHEEEGEVFKAGKKILTASRAKNLAIEMDEMKQKLSEVIN